MGMYGTLRRANAADVERFRASPSLVESFVLGDPLPPPPDRGGLFGFLRRHSPFGGTATQPADPGAAPAPAPPPTWRPAAEGEELQLDKAWHGLHFLFTGEAEGGEEPGCYLLEGGEDIGEDEGGAPVASLLSPQQVRAFAAFLDILDRDTLKRRFDPARMVALDIYPSVIWERDEEYPPVRYLLDAYDDLREFMATAAKAGDSVVICIG